MEQWCIETFKLNLSIFRISNIFGDPQFHDLINKILNSWKKDSVLALFDTNRFSRDIISIDDISMIVGQSLLNRFNPEGGVFYLNISSNIAITTDAILALIGDVAQYEIEVKSIETPGSVPIKHQLSNQKLLDFLPALRIDPMKDLEIYFRKRLEITPSRIDFRL